MGVVLVAGGGGGGDVLNQLLTQLDGVEELQGQYYYSDSVLVSGGRDGGGFGRGSDGGGFGSGGGGGMANQILTVDGVEGLPGRYGYSDSVVAIGGVSVGGGTVNNGAPASGAAGRCGLCGRSISI